MSIEGKFKKTAKGSVDHTGSATVSHWKEISVILIPLISDLVTTHACHAKNDSPGKEFLKNK